MLSEDVLKRMKEDEVKYINLQFVDLMGVVKEVVIPSGKLEEALQMGLWFDGSSVEGFARIQESDLFLKPDPSTYALIPWLSEGGGKCARLICDIYSSDGKPFPGDPRHILKRAIKRAEEEGFRFFVGPEPEFYIFRRERPREITDRQSYFDLISEGNYTLLKNIITALKSFGIEAETSHHEVGPGQYEIDFRYGDSLCVADKLLTLKYTVKTLSGREGYHATFMPKPLMGMPGSGMHVHQSLFEVGGKNAFYDPADPYGLSDVAYHFIGGQIKHIKAMCAILAPTDNSYKRLVSGFEAPIYITWARMNRSALIRVPGWFEGKGESARVELRCPDSTSNPYLAFAVMLMAGLDGVKKKVDPPPPTEENTYTMSRETLEENGIDTLPSTLYEALEEYLKDEITRETFGDYLYRRYYEVKMREWEEYSTHVSDWEIEKYYQTY
ncbi:MAG: hypothetical protein DRN42_01545 [Thermoplasmata archaeon]|nr:MAG: hypothetical protein DRN42_01545 [Thermoplasmata archaeon]